MTTLTIPELLSSYSTSLPDNDTGLITPAVLRDTFTDTVLSIQAADAVLAGVAGGQTLNGGTGVGETLTLRGTSDAGNGKVIVPALDATSITLPKTSGTAIKVDNGFAWRDLTGDITPKTSGAGSPTLSTITGDIRGWRYSVGDDGDCVFHLPHDYAPGTDLFFHAHWTHNGTAISGSFEITVYASYAKGHQQASFSAQKVTTILDGGLSIGTAPTLHHRIPEIQFTVAGGDTDKIDTNLLEVDGLILVHFDVVAIPTISGGASNEPFLLTFDIHYQSTCLGTKNKSPGFYA
jgi:hypothetical protein